MTVSPIPAENSTGGWQGRLCLGFVVRDSTTILAENSHHGPLRVQLPLYPEGGVCHTCILHPPGGLVGGDRLELHLAAGEGAHALLTTPGATKFYRSAGLPAVQHQYLTVRGGTLEWFPQDTILFPGAEAEITTEIRLEGEAVFIGWEVLCLGLPTRNERFSHGRLRNRLALYRDGRPLFLERLNVSGEDDLASPAGLRNWPVTATFLATGVKEAYLAELRALLPQDGGSLTGITLLDDLLVGRYLGSSTFEAREIFQNLWAGLRPLLLGRKACPPRIWST